MVTLSNPSTVIYISAKARPPRNLQVFQPRAVVINTESNLWLVLVFLEFDLILRFLSSLLLLPLLVKGDVSSERSEIEIICYSKSYIKNDNKSKQYIKVVDSKIYPPCSSQIPTDVAKPNFTKVMYLEYRISMLICLVKKKVI